MPSMLSSTMQWLHPKDDDRNLISATFHMLTITLISMSLANLTWFTISGERDLSALSLGQFFWFGYGATNRSEYSFITGNIANSMRITILLCFMAIIFSLAGFFLDINDSKSDLYRMVRRYGVPGTCTVLWLMSIVSISYYIVQLLEASLASHYPTTELTVSYGFGFYLLTGAGAVCLFGIFYNLIVAYRPASYYRDNDVRCLIEDDDFDDSLDTFNRPTPPPPYNMPPPPYSP